MNHLMAVRLPWQASKITQSQPSVPQGTEAASGFPWRMSWGTGISTEDNRFAAGSMTKVKTSHRTRS
ncbi:hypothetical protein BSU04_02015 [Caballeronia sordidicola]|uniref:Uncharacterized protein n=1 Tax=Caballeronia sordidicola TaxID=196367 RepID=A0A226XBB0_CABSO|nr:hypothetical protein BSU04_02015 [Caballeronia sordidicola]